MRKTSKCRTESISVFSSVAAERLADYRGGTDASPSVSLKDIDGTITGSMSGCITGGQETDPSPSSSHHDQPTSRETSKMLGVPDLLFVHTCLEIHRSQVQKSWDPFLATTSAYPMSWEEVIQPNSDFRAANHLLFQTFRTLCSCVN
ncbi:uncharacterized protein LOC111083953 isoform X1 [Limulus polyphemus]|uniref:Uncharacterized protein LOC111083953 isoform X1 n=1 Tax=Limulus polyphemus TaxID=6850 RepID=A0ABM1RYG2_LIMPO|nr:uncharacterized protein LOC111083953 isoform X1 [Limulus polyphemus]